MVSDTHPDVAAMQREMLRRMTKEQRLKLALEMSNYSHACAIELIRSQHPEFNQRQVIRELVRRWYRITLPE